MVKKKMNKKSSFGFSSVALIIIAIIGGLAVITIISYMLGIFTDPGQIQEGIKCRLAIKASSTIREATFGATPEQMFDACATLEQTIPMREEYPFIAKNLNRMSADQLKEVVMFDFAHLVNNAWWITGEGDWANSILDKLQNILVSENDCYVVYAVRIDTTKKFTTITANDLQIEAINDIRRSDLRVTSGKGDPRTIRDYITLDGKGAGVFLETNDSKIEYQEEGADPHYGIAVGFAKKGALPALATRLWKGEKRISRINKGESFIYIAPYNEIAGLCKVIE